MTTTKRTDELVRGDRLLIGNRLVRTVESVVPNGYVNRRDEPLYNVTYAEGEEPGVWSGGNSGAPGTEWTVLDERWAACGSCGTATLTPPVCAGCSSAAGIGALGRWPS
jgi:hypothetical protein